LETNVLGESHPLAILVAEDNPVNQRVAILMLRRLGYRADVAANGREALEAVERQRYDLVLMDVQMPEMDGLQAAREIRSRFAVEVGPRIVAMTANASTSDRDECFAAGMDDFMTKPVRDADLRRAIQATRIRYVASAAA
jgi:CheY-like chemotaxis protein